jgi:hypothetical protein
MPLALMIFRNRSQPIYPALLAGFGGIGPRLDSSVVPMRRDMIVR